MLILQILAFLMILLLGAIFAQLNADSSKLMTIIHQLEYLGAPLEIRNGKVVAKISPDDEEHEIRKRMTRDH